MKRFDLRRIMLKAWELFRKEHDLSFSECLHRAWISAKAVEINEKRIERAKIAAGVTEPTATWSDWKKAGYEVIHGSKALFGCGLIWGGVREMARPTKPGSLDSPKYRHLHKEKPLPERAL